MTTTHVQTKYFLFLIFVYFWYSFYRISTSFTHDDRIIGLNSLWKLWQWRNFVGKMQGLTTPKHKSTLGSKTIRGTKWFQLPLLWFWQVFKERMISELNEMAKLKDWLDLFIWIVSSSKPGSENFDVGEWHQCNVTPQAHPFKFISNFTSSAALIHNECMSCIVLHNVTVLLIIWMQTWIMPGKQWNSVWFFMSSHPRNLQQIAAGWGSGFNHYYYYYHYFNVLLCDIFSGHYCFYGFHFSWWRGWGQKQNMGTAGEVELQDGVILLRKLRVRTSHSCRPFSSADCVSFAASRIGNSNILFSY